MQLLDGENCKGQMSVSLVYYLVELDLQVYSVFLLHVDEEVDRSHNDKGEENTKDDIEIETEDPWASISEEEVLGVDQ